jgi:hypothetical protein
VPRGLRNMGGFCCHTDGHQHQQDDDLRSGVGSSSSRKRSSVCKCSFKGGTKESPCSTAGSSIACQCDALALRRSIQHDLNCECS